MGESKPDTGVDSKTNSKSAKLWSSLSYLRHREIHGVSEPNDKALSRFYKHTSLRRIWEAEQEAASGGHGAIFNVEFSPSGDLLVAACERHTILVFDPLSQKLLKTITGAHSDCVNCVRFLDTRSFVTCSDDTTIALWDSRNLKSKVRSLEGHSNWVKSVEYHKPSGLLVTSAFDDTVRTWDINSYSNSEGPCSQVVLHFENLIRMKMCPDGSKMIISGIPGNMLVIHNLSLDYLHRDLEGYEHVDQYQWNILDPEYSNVRFTAAHRWPNKGRNSVESIHDFPEECSPWCISSLDVHPHGWCTLARYTCRKSKNEWTVLHDIQDLDTNNSEEANPSQLRRLTYSIPEPIVARGYIKEPCFSNDGRVICSPFGNTARILGFSPECDELSKCLDKTPLELSELKTLISHKDAVLTCRFSPTHSLLSMGCLGGKVSFYQPRL